MRRSIRCLFASAAASLACSGGEGEQGAESDLAARGRHYYQNVCIACHNGDPRMDGTLGPAIAGASLELLEAKVLRGEYPPGYTPKRDTGTMPRFEYLAPEIEGLAAYLAKAAATERS
jgi:mono/diheme cytochrome c family protein